MPLELVMIPCLADNFAYLIHSPDSGETALIDAPEAGPILKAIESRGWHLGQIILTHHHADHIQDAEKTRAATGAKILGAAKDRHRLPSLDQALEDGDRIRVGGEGGIVIGVPGHTTGHIALYFPDSALLFTADSLMAAGCGRLFEGSAEQMWQSLQKLAALPAETRVCSGHEYLDMNLSFARQMEPDSKAIPARIAKVAALRAAGQPVMPWRLDEELETNPFLRADLPALRRATGLLDAPASAVFAEIRRRKDALS